MQKYYELKLSKVNTKVALSGSLQPSVSKNPDGTSNKEPSGVNWSLLKNDLKVSSWKYFTSLSFKKCPSGTSTPKLQFRDKN